MICSVCLKLNSKLSLTAVTTSSKARGLFNVGYTMFEPFGNLLTSNILEINSRLDFLFNVNLR